MSGKLIAFWILGGVFILFGAWILNNLELTIGVSDYSYALALVVAFIAFLIGGLFWISVGVASKH